MVIGKLAGKFSALLRAKDHQITSGIDEKLGGGDEGLNPHELLESALVACTVITVEMYARRKSWDLHAIEVSAQIDHENGDTVITRKISLQGKLDYDQRIRLLEIADKCPIHRLSTQKIEVRTTLD